MRRLAGFVILLTVVSLAACRGGKPAEPEKTAELKTEDEKTLYAIGLAMGGNLGSLHLTPAEVEVVTKGLQDAVNGRKPQVDLQAYGPKIQALASARQGAGAQAEKEKSAGYQDAAAREPGATKTPSGLVIQTLRPGTGASPAPTDVVKVHYEGSLTNGTVFDSSVKRGQPAEFPLNGVIPCWTEGLQRMKVGEKAKLVCPSSIAYGDQGRPPTIPGGATLVFEVELLEIKK